VLAYILAGLALGSIYAITAASLVVTYVSAGVLNFAFGAMAFTVARFYYWMHTQHGNGIVISALVALLAFAPVMGIALYLGVFRFLRQRSSLIKIVVTIGISVALPPLVVIAFGNQAIASAPALAPRPLHVFHILGSTVNMDQLLTYIFLVGVVLVGTAVLRYTDVGLRVRAMVDSEALTSLSGTNPSAVALGVWAVSAMLAGLAGILLSPQGLDVTTMSTLMASSFAAVVAARLRSLPVAVVVALLMGAVTDGIQYYLPTSGGWTQNLVPSIPFLFMVISLVYYLARTGRVNEAGTGAGALDRAIAAPSAASVRASTPAGRSLSRWSPWRAAPVVPLIVLAFLPILFSGYWLNLAAGGLALGVALLSYTIVTGEGGMIWLCQITFAGGGSVIAAELAANHGWPSLPAAIVGGVAMMPVGALIGAVTIRLGDLYVALVTLAFGVLMDVLVFPLNRFYEGGVGVAINRPSFATSDRDFAYLCLGIIVLIGLLIVNFRRSTTGLAMSAVRWSEPASRTLGLSVVKMKLIVAALSAFTAGLGGALIAMWNGSSLTTSYSTFEGLIWLAVLVTVGVRSVSAAALAGLAFTMMPNVFQTYLPHSTKWLQVPAVLFGLGAIGIAVNPDGVLAQYARNLQKALVSAPGRRRDGKVGDPPRSDGSPPTPRSRTVGPTVVTKGM
jgi:branched-chain amino acid transport system permease protein